MNSPLKPADAAALLAAQGIEATPEGAEADARFATLMLGKSAAPFARLAFEDEPSGYTAGLRRNAP
jgi:hypothetical protein